MCRVLPRPLRSTAAPTEDEEDLVPLAAEEYDRLARFFDEASVPILERFYCAHSDCARLFAVPHRDQLVKYAQTSFDDTPSTFATSSRLGTDTVRSLRARLGRALFRGAAGPVHVAQPVADLEREEAEDSLFQRRKFADVPPWASCPFCARDSCVRCNVPAHPLAACGASPDETATRAFIRATSKACPQCSMRITHSHGHACHHIMPGRGCPNCGTHFCYKCLRRGTSGAACGCLLFCQNDGVRDHIQTHPYPSDARCGCTFCSQCRLGSPCEQCDGGCVVCRGTVPPGPSDATQVATWKLS